MPDDLSRTHPSGRPRPVRPVVEALRAGVGADAGMHPHPEASPAVLVSNRIGSLLKQSLGRGPESVRTHVLADLVVVLMAGAMTPVERTLSEAGRPDAVLDQRRAFQDVMAPRFKEIVREVTGREVVAMMSANHVSPDLALETFVLGEPVDGPGVL